MGKKKEVLLIGSGLMDSLFGPKSYQKEEIELNKNIDEAKNRISEGERKINEGITIAKNSVHEFTAEKIKKVFGRGYNKNNNLKGSGLFNDLKNSLIEKGKEVVKNEGQKLINQGIDMAKNKAQDYAQSKFNSIVGSGLKRKRGRPKKINQDKVIPIVQNNLNGKGLRMSGSGLKMSGKGLFKELGNLGGTVFGGTRGGPLGSQVGGVIGSTIGSKMDSVFGMGLDNTKKNHILASPRENNNDYRPRNGNVPQFYVKRKTQL